MTLTSQNRTRAELARAPGPPRLLPATWPLTLLLVGFPVLWALGLSAFAVQIAAVPMAWQLLARRPVRVPRGFGIWLLFLVVSAAGGLVLGVDPSGTVTSSMATRLVSFLTRETTYVALTVVLLYIGNLTERELSERRVIGQLCFFFVTVTAGGVAGLLWPHASFPSPLTAVVPDKIAAIPYVSRIIHPVFAQVQEFSGSSVPRPAAPFGDTNTWGAQLSMLAIWLVVGWLIRGRLRERWVAVPLLLVGGVCIVYSVNRGVWLGVLLGVGMTLVLLAVAGRWKPLVAVALVTGLLGIAFALSPLTGVLEQRLENGKSNGIRTFTTVRAFDLAGQSPVVGFGSTRNAVGSRTSIAIGKSPECPNCGNIPIGINGFLWTLLVSTGWVGTVLFVGFWAQQAWISRRLRSLSATAAQVTLATALFYGLFYNIDFTVPFVALAFLWRQRADAAHGDASRPLTEPAGDVDAKVSGAADRGGRLPPARRADPGRRALTRSGAARP